MNADVVLASLAMEHKGVVATRHAHERGVTDRQLFARRRSGLLVPLYRGVDRHAACPFTHDTRLEAGMLACGDDSVLGRRSAAVTLGFSRVRRWKPEIITPHLDLPRIDGITIIRTRHLLPAEVVHVRGFAVTSKGRTALDLCGVLSYDEAAEIIAESIITGVLSIPDLLSGIELGGGRGCAGTVACRSIAGGAVDLDGLDSILEYDLSKVIDRARVARPVRQLELTCADGRNVRLDNAWPDLKLSVEGDGMRWHATPKRLRETQARSRSIQGTGWVHLVYGWSDVHAFAASTQSEIEWHYRERTIAVGLIPVLCRAADRRGTQRDTKRTGPSQGLAVRSM